MKLVGIDGARRGHWVVASAGDHACVRFDLATNLISLFELATAGEVLVVIDVPIGILSANEAPAGRACDAEARRVVGPKRAPSVFTPPCREAFGSSTQFEASGRNERVCGRRVSAQAFGILGRIGTVDSLMTIQLQRNVREGHPEVTFAGLAGKFIENSKKTQAGTDERLDILLSNGIRFDLAAERLRLGRGNVSRDDMIGAAAMLATARRIRDCVALTLGNDASDSRGLLMQMWA